MHGKHRGTGRSHRRESAMRKFSRKSKIVAGIAAAVVLIGGVAVAMFIARAPFGGEVSSGNVNLLWVTGSGGQFQVVDAESGACSIQAPNGQDMPAQVYAKDMLPGGSCTFKVTVRGQGALKLTGVTIAGLPEGWTSELTGPPCGTDISKDLVGSEVRFKIGYPEGATVSSTKPITGSVDAVLASDFDPSLCS